MLFKRYQADQDNTKQETGYMRLIVAGMILVIGLQTMTILKLVGSEKTHLIPPVINRSFWVSGAEVSKEHLEEMAYWYAGLALNITPVISEYQNSLFLKFAAPSEYGRLQAEMGSRAEFLKKNNTATQFSVNTITTDEKNMMAALAGTLVTWTSDKKAGERTVTYMLGFKFINGRLYVSDFKETSAQNPFGNPAHVQP